MAEIKVLPGLIADKIAAGEVAERPSAVVKELVENSIDAGATKISVEIRNGGIKYISVEDNGKGIKKDEIETAFLRHATSKLREIEDLEKIRTMGFRGEALASISAVAQVEVISKTADAPSGTYMKVERGIAQPKEDIACNNGTIMVVENLFENVPARMKFLKKDSTEAGYISDVVSRIAMAHPEIMIKMTVDGKELFSTNGDGDIKNVVLNVYGIDYAKALIEVDYKEGPVHITGVIGKPEIVRGNRSRQTIFVNKRYIKNYGVAKVAEEAYRNAVMVGKFPFFVLNIDLPSELVDVNVHPAKTEVKFANEKELMEAVYHSVKNALFKDTTPEKVQEKKSEEVKPEPENNTVQFRMNFKSNFKREEAPKKEIENLLSYTVREETAEEKSEKDFEEILEIVEEKEPEIPVKLVGQLFDTYILYEQGENFFLLDQHAGHERLRFEKLKEDYINKKKFGQVLMIPVVMNVTLSEMEIIKEYSEYFDRMGFEIEEFGNDGIVIRQTPIITDDNEIKALVSEIVTAFDEKKKMAFADREEAALDMISCKYAIKANHKLTSYEMEDLILRVNELKDKGITTCPHGRPIQVQYTKTEIEKMFKRIV